MYHIVTFRMGTAIRWSQEEISRDGARHFMLYSDWGLTQQIENDFTCRYFMFTRP